MSWTFWKPKTSPENPDAEPADRPPGANPGRRKAAQGERCHDETSAEGTLVPRSKPQAGRPSGEGADGRPTCCGGGGR